MQNTKTRTLVNLLLENNGPLNFENSDFCNMFVSMLYLENCSRYFLEALCKCISPAHVHASMLIIFRERLMHLPSDFIFDRVLSLG